MCLAVTINLVLYCLQPEAMSFYQRFLQAMSILVNKTSKVRSPVLRPVVACCVSSQKESWTLSPIKQDCHAQAASEEGYLILLLLSPP